MQEPYWHSLPQPIHKRRLFWDRYSLSTLGWLSEVENPTRDCGVDIIENTIRKTDISTGNEPILFTQWTARLHLAAIFLFISLVINQFKESIGRASFFPVLAGKVFFNQQM